MPIIVGVVAAITVIVVVNSSFINNELPLVSNEKIIENMEDSEIPSSQIYKINTQCEMLFAITTSTYPNGEAIPRFNTTSLFEKYPDEFKEWKEILADPEKRKVFAQDVPDEFNQVLIPVLMKESSINPDLKSTAMLITDPQANLKLKQIYDENNCQEFFSSHSKPTP
ncbi:MAG TPA: hypothetical protein VLA53_05975 [Nitrosopumilaceae archaeon]|nr:hypothetical protein [Nitrosopumilaceae archaeon]